MKCDIIQMSVVNNLGHVITRIGGHTMYTCGKPLGLIFETRKKADKQRGGFQLEASKRGITWRDKDEVYYSSWANLLTQVFGASGQINLSTLMESLIPQGEKEVRLNYITSPEEIPGTEVEEQGKYSIPEGVELDAKIIGALEKKIYTIPERMIVLEEDGNIIVACPRDKQLELYFLRR